MKKYFLFPLLALIILLGFIFFSNEKTPVVGSFEDCIEEGYPVMESYPRGCKTPDGKTFTEEIGNELEKADLIRSDDPRPNQTISSPLLISGEARGPWFFEASFSAKVLDARGKELGQGIMTAEGEWMTTNFVPFKGQIVFETPDTDTGELILEKSNPSGLPENDDQLIVPIKFSVNKETESKSTVKIFFNKKDDILDCSKVFSVEREIDKTISLGKVALEELIKGPTLNEKQDGYITSINKDTKLKSLIIENGVARADFSEELDRHAGGSCSVASIRSAITETLKQFPTVREVIISINGNSELILQP